MRKAFIRILCLLLGLNVFTACYGPAIPPENMQDELEALAAQDEGAPEAEPQPETEGEEQIP